MSEKQKRIKKKSVKEISISEIFSISKFTSLGLIIFLIAIIIAFLFNRQEYSDITFAFFAFSFQITLFGLIIDILRWRDYSDWGALGAIIAYIGFFMVFLILYFPLFKIEDDILGFLMVIMGIILLVIGFTSRATEIDYKIETLLSNLWKAIRTYNYRAVIPYLLSLIRTFILGFIRYIGKGLLGLRNRIRMFLDLVYRGLAYTFYQTKIFLMQTFPLTLKRLFIGIWNNFHWIGLVSGILFLIMTFSPQDNLWITIGFVLIITFFFVFGVIYPQSERIINIATQIQEYSWKTGIQLNYRLRTVADGWRKIKCANCNNEIPLGSQQCDSCRKEVLRCMICKLPMKQGQKLTECPKCNNSAHEDHWNFWINLNRDCPLCKKTITG